MKLNAVAAAAVPTRDGGLLVCAVECNVYLPYLVRDIANVAQESTRTGDHIPTRCRRAWRAELRRMDGYGKGVGYLAIAICVQRSMFSV